MSSAIRRLQKDFLDYQANREEFTLISAEPLEENLFEWHINICAPDGPYANLPLHFIMQFPKDYPSSPPDVKLCTIINHPNVFKNWGDSGAWICLDLLKAYTTKTKYEGWSSCYTVTSILLQLQSFLFSENVPQDYGGNSSLELSNHDVVSSLARIKGFKCKCGHHWTTPKPALPKAFCKRVEAKVSHSGSKLLAEEGAVINQDTVFWQEFPTWKIAAYDCGNLCKTRGDKMMYEVKIDWGWDGYYQEDVRIGWGFITSRNPLKYEVVAESPADIGVHFWPAGIKVGDILTTGIDLKRNRAWYALNGKMVSYLGEARHEMSSHFSCQNVGSTKKNARFFKKPFRDGIPEDVALVPICRFRCCRLKFNFGLPKCPVKPLLTSGYLILEKPKGKEAPAADIASWKADKDAVADVFPPQVFQDIIEFLPMPSIINARASCGSIRSLIEEAAVIPRREVHCFKTKMTWKECTLGVGLTCEKNDKKQLEEVKPNMEFLSLQEWENGQRASAWGEPLTDFLVLPVSRKHFNLELVCKYMQKFGAEYRLGGGRSASEILNVFSKLMNMCVVTMMKETQAGKCNEKLLTGYTQFHHILLSLNEHFPEVAALAQKRVNRFVSSEAFRHKKDTPDLGKLLVMASLCPGLDMVKFQRVLFIECSRRRVLWYLKDCNALSNVEHNDEDYCQRVFELTEVSRGVVAFQLAFLTTFALPKKGESLNDVLSSYYLRYGQPRSADMESLFKQAKAIVECKTWAEHLRHCGLSMGGTELARILKASVDRSLKAGYHRGSSSKGGRLGQTRGNPACKGTFRGTGASAINLDYRASLYLPTKNFPKVREIVMNISGCKVALPKSIKEPIVVGAYERNILAHVKNQLRNEFPYLSTKAPKTVYVEFRYEMYTHFEEPVNALADKFNVRAKMPKKDAFPVAIICGSERGTAGFIAAVENLTSTILPVKTEDCSSFVCPQCDMEFVGRDGALCPKIEDPTQGVTVCRFCWQDYSKKSRWSIAGSKNMKQWKKEQRHATKLKKAWLDYIAELKKSEGEFPAPIKFTLQRDAQVREEKSMQSEKLEIIDGSSVVEVVEIVKNRARIISPIAGWVSVTTNLGLLIAPKCVTVEEEEDEPEPEVFKAPQLTKPFAALFKTKDAETAKKEDDSRSEHDASSDSGSTQTERKFIKIGVNANATAPKQKTYEGRAIIRGRSYTLARDAIIRAGIKRDSRYITTLTQESVVYVEKVFPKAHRAKITSPVRGWISTWTKNGRLLQ